MRGCRAETVSDRAVPREPGAVAAGEVVVKGIAVGGKAGRPEVRGGGFDAQMLEEYAVGSSPIHSNRELGRGPAVQSPAPSKTHAEIPRRVVQTDLVKGAEWHEPRSRLGRPPVSPASLDT